MVGFILTVNTVNINAPLAQPLHGLTKELDKVINKKSNK